MADCGLIISNPVEVGSNRLMVTSSGLDPQEIRFALLFWDKFDFPTSNLVHIENCGTADYLAKCGLLTRTVIRSGGGEMSEIIRSIFLDAYRDLSKREPGCWSIATGEKSIVFLDDDLTPGNGALLKLHRTLPVPDKDVPLADILEFRQRRRSELLALRHHLERIYQKIALAEDSALAMNTEVEALNAAVDDYISTLRGLSWLFRLVDFDASLNVSDALRVGAVTYATTTSLVASATAAATTLAALSIKPGPSLKKAPNSETPFRYVARYHSDLFPLS